MSLNQFDFRIGLNYTYSNTMANFENGSSLTYQKKRSLFDAVYQKLLLNSENNLNNSNNSNNNGNYNLRKKKLGTSKSSSIPIDLNHLYTFQIFQGAQLSVWHDTAGPVVEQLWRFKEINTDFQAFTARQTLCGLDPKNTVDEIRFNIYPDQGLMVLSHIFNSKYNDSLTKFALSVFLSISNFNEYLSIHDIIVDRVTCLSCKLLKNYSLNIQDHLELFTKELVLTMINVEQLFLSGYPSINISSTCFNDSKIDQEFLVKALTSHFQTYGSTIIIGNNTETVLMWMDTISLFLTPKERKLASRNLNHKEYIPDIMIQGFTDVTLKQIDERLHFSLRPSTVIDTEKLLIYQTKRNHEYIDKRIDLFSKLIVDNFQGQVKEIDNLILFKNSSTFIQKMVSEVFQLPFHLKEIFLLQSIKSLLRKSSIVITALQHLSFLSSNEQKFKISQLFTPPLNDIDIELLYGLAEKLQFYLFVSITKPESLNIEDTIMEIFTL